MDTEKWEHDRKEMFSMAEECRKAMGLTEKQYKNSLVLLAGVYVGHSDTRIAKFAGLSRGFVIPRKKKLLKAGIWYGDNLTNAQWCEKDGDVAFLLDIMVLDGTVERVTAPEEETGEEEEAH